MKALRRDAFLLCMLAGTSTTEASEICVQLVGTELVKSEVRENLTGTPGKLMEHEEKEQPIKAGGASWCVSEDGISYFEPRPKNVAGGKTIRVKYPFGGGFVQSKMTIVGRPVDMLGIAQKADDVISVNWKYTMGSTLSKADIPINLSSRREISFDLVLTPEAWSLTPVEKVRGLPTWDGFKELRPYAPTYAAKFNNGPSSCLRLSASASPS
jgi:hypothetical protein